MRVVRSATVVLPAYRIGDAVTSVIRDLAVAAYALRERAVEMDVLLLHDRPDAVASAVRAARELSLPLTCIQGPAAGAGAAFLSGFRRVLDGGRADVVVTLDANGRHDATQIPHLIDQLVTEDVDVVIGSRWAGGSGTPGLSLRRWMLGRLANLAFRVLTDTWGIADATTSFRVARVEVVRDFAFKVSHLPVIAFRPPSWPWQWRMVIACARVRSFTDPRLDLVVSCRLRMWPNSQPTCSRCALRSIVLGSTA